tara:strand:- start:675 stop:2111 length:1437 start_codon:yes stop_codon:yes gene_type:complete
MYFISGALWGAFQTMSTRIITLISQFVLSFLLLPSEFGTISIALAFTTIISVVQNFGISDVLVARSNYFYRIYDLSKSISLITCLITIILSLVAAFFSLYFYNDNQIFNLILLFSVTVPFNTLSIVPDANLRIQLKFKLISYSKVLEIFLMHFSIVSLVLLNFGIYSFFIGPIISSIFRYFHLHFLANLNHRFSLTFHHYKYLLTNSVRGLIFSVSETCIRQIDYIILSIFASNSIVGIYYMGYTLSVQSASLLVNSLKPNLLPSLMKIPFDEKKKKRQILLSIIKVFSILGFPFAFWQFLIAEPLVSIFLNDNWQESIIIIQILSIGMGFNIFSTMWYPSLTMLSLFKELYRYSLLSLLYFVLLVTIGSYLYGYLGTACCVTFYYISSSLLLLITSLKFHQIKPLEILINLKYFFFSLFIFGTFFCLTKFLDLKILELIINLILSPILYILFLKKFDNKSYTFIYNILIKKIKKVKH